MSRYEILHEDKGLAFGNDHACGEFIMIWTRPADPMKRKEQDNYGPEPEDVLVDKDTLFDKDFNKEQMLKLIKEHGFDVSELQEAKREKGGGIENE
jgi:hypothetical protein